MSILRAAAARRDASDGRWLVSFIDAMGTTKEAAERFYPALDGLRAIAIIAVLISHYYPDRSLVMWSFHWGRFGVMLFFVLSGFLITGLLLRGRDAVGVNGVTRGAVFRAFVARRALRIAPIYYLVVLVGWWVGYRPIAEFLPWHLTYTGNIAMAYFDAKLAQATHLWSLCVEEQFYLLWPAVVLLVPGKKLAYVAMSLILYSTGHEIVGTLQGRTFEQTHLVLQGCMDALGLGALLGIFVHRFGIEGSRTQQLSLYASLGGAPLLFFSQGYRYTVGIRATEHLAYRLPADLGMALISVSLVFLAISSGPSLIRRGLELAPLRFIGRISYGIYLYHLFLIAIGRMIAREQYVPELPRGFSMFVAYSALSILIATASWYLIEAPINRQKRRFPYPPKGTNPA
jgi:peptidoglycan/LPS O-acetylase OafA/YrhL